MKEISKILKKSPIARNYRNTHEFQAYGNRLAEEMGEPDKRALYLRLAKTVDRTILDQAREFVLARENATTKGKLFMWKVKQIRLAKKEKEGTTSKQN